MSAKMPKIRLLDGSGTIELKHLSADRDRHGTTRYYFRRPGQPKIRIRGAAGSDEFMANYRAAFEGILTAAVPNPKRRAPAGPGSLRWLVELFYQSSDFKRLGCPTVRRRILDTLCEEPIASDVAGTVGILPYRAMLASKVRALRDRKADTPEAANSRLKAVRRLFAWAIDNDLADHNPARDVKKLRNDSTGFHTWTVAEIAQFEKRHPIGTMARLALGLLLFTGQRRSDVVVFGPQHLVESRGLAPHLRETHAGKWIALTQKKTGVCLTLPVLPELQELIDSTADDGLTFIATSFGKPFSAAGFGNWFRERCDEAGLRHCSAHGLRKAGATIAAEHGVTERQLQAIFGWKAARESARYTQAASQKFLAGAAMKFLVPDHAADKIVPPLSASEKSGTKTGKNANKNKAKKIAWRPRQDSNLRPSA
jgi:integrase